MTTASAISLGVTLRMVFGLDRFAAIGRHRDVLAHEASRSSHSRTARGPQSARRAGDHA